MPILSDYSQFDGRHWETGSVHNALAYQGTRVPEIGRPISEAMLMGISGGAAFGYFVFDYEGVDPHVSLLSRNTFDPLDAMLERLGIQQDLYNTSDATKGERNLIEILESGRPAIVWADIFGLPYNALPANDQMWAMMPVVVYGFQDGEVRIADRSSQPLRVSAEELAAARARIKKDKFRVLALGQPDLSKLPGAIQKGIWQCIALYTEAPPKGGRDSFGFAAYEKWTKMLTNTRNKQSWERQLPPGSKMYAALAGYGYQPGAFGWARTFASNQVDDRRLYAEFLDEAAMVLSKPGLREAGDLFRASSEAWSELSEALLPDEVAPFKQAKELLLRKRDLFIAEGGAASSEIRDIYARLDEIHAEASQKFPVPESEVAAMRERIAEHVEKVASIERNAVDQLQAAME